MTPESIEALPHWKCKQCGGRTEEFKPVCKCGCWSFTYSNVELLAWLQNEVERIAQ